MRYLPDTNVFIALAAGQEAILRKLRFIPTRDVGLSAIVHHELFYGAFKGTKRDESLANIGELRFPTVPFDEEDAFRAGEIRAYLQARGTPIGAYDTLIAGQALARDLTLVSRNIREFSRVDGLRVENWEG